MSDFKQLDDFICGLGLPTETEPAISVNEAANFMVNLKKLAQDEEAVEHIEEVATGQEASIGEGEAQYQAGVPDTTGHLEGEFAVPVEQVVQVMASIVAHKLKAQIAYLFYAETLRDTARDGLAMLFKRLARGDARDISYFMQRISVLMPGGIQLPVAPMPEPLHDTKKILEVLIAIEQQGIVTMKHLRAMMGENPMKFTVEEMLSHEQEHLDSLWQYMPAKVPKKKQEKLASAIKVARDKLAAPQKPKVPEGATVIPEPGSEPPEQAQLREAQLQAEEAMGVAQHHAQRSQLLEEQATMGQAALESANAQAQMSAQQAMAAQEQAMASQDQAMQAMEQAAMSEENAAQQADAKMRLAMRIQQLRQTLADVVSSDPVQEEGVGFGEQAGPGGPVTSQQQAAAQDQAMMEEQAMADQAAAGSSKPAKAKKEVNEAQNAQAEAAEQTAEAQQAVAS